MKCEWHNPFGHGSQGDAATCVVSRSDVNTKKGYWFTCKDCYRELKNRPFIELITDDPDLMVCYAVLKS